MNAASSPQSVVDELRRALVRLLQLANDLTTVDLRAFAACLIDRRVDRVADGALEALVAAVSALVAELGALPGVGGSSNLAPTAYRSSSRRTPSPAQSPISRRSTLASGSATGRWASPVLREDRRARPRQGLPRARELFGRSLGQDEKPPGLHLVLVLDHRVLRDAEPDECGE
jgi:hypothetical protein